MRIPSLIAQPLFYRILRIVRRGSPIPPIRRAIQSYPLEEQLAFNNLWDSSIKGHQNQLIDYQLPYPRLDFLNYLCDWLGYVAHGSIAPDLTVLQPVRYSTDSSEFGNRQQIFCAPDAIWAIWFAILDKSKCHMTENGCMRVGSGQKRLKYYHFDLLASCRRDPPFTIGMIYLAKAVDFPFRHHYPMLDLFDAEIEEWGSINPVTPLARLQVGPEDFPYLDKVQYRL